MKKAVEFKNVSFCYNNSPQVLSDVSFTLNYGEITLLTGESGQGKSTVLSVIAGIIPNVAPGEISGEILINGESISGKPLSETCREAGVVLQNADSQIIHNTVEDESAFGCENFGFPQDRISRCIEVACNKTGLEKNMATRTLSGGQKQKLITASALATEQKILIFDEPLANLDVKFTLQLMRLLRRLADEGYCILIIEHRTDMIADFADRFLTIRNGKITESEKREVVSNSTKQIPDTSVYSAQKEILLKLKNVNFTVKKKEILKDVSLEVYKGERLLILGENGCGKTTLMRILAKLYKPTGGEYIQNILPSERRNKGSKKWFGKVGVVYQNPNYQLFMPSVKQEIEFNAFSPEYAREITNRFNLEKIADRHPQSLSEGQKRKVTLAAVLAGKPDLLLLDEPTVGQDYNSLFLITNAINQIHNETGSTIITITHDVRCADAFCDRAAVIKEGKVLNIGGKETAQEFFEQLSKEIQL